MRTAEIARKDKGDVLTRLDVMTSLQVCLWKDLRRIQLSHHKSERFKNRLPLQPFKHHVNNGKMEFRNWKVYFFKRVN